MAKRKQPKVSVGKSLEEVAPKNGEPFTATVVCKRRESWAVEAETIGSRLRAMAREEHIGASVKLALQHLAHKADAIVAMEKDAPAASTAGHWFAIS